MKLKLNTDAPEQHMVILGAAGVLIFLSVLQGIKSDDKSGTETIVRGPNDSKYDNPTLSWYERAFCRGFQRSSYCSYKLLHPMRDELVSKGVQLREGPPKSSEPARFIGKLSGSRNESGAIILDETE